MRKPDIRSKGRIDKVTAVDYVHGAMFLFAQAITDEALEHDQMQIHLKR